MNNKVLGINEKPQKISQWLMWSLQHVFAMFTANTLISINIFGGYMMVPAALVSAGIGTIIYLLITKFRSPVFLGSSAGLISIMSTCFTMSTIKDVDVDGTNFLALIIGLIVVGVVYCVVGFIIRKFGTTWLHKLLPNIVIGSVIVVIGLSLAPFGAQWSIYNSITSTTAFNGWGFLVAFITIIATCIYSYFGKGLVKTLPFLLALLTGFAISLLLTGCGYLFNIEAIKLVDFSAFSDIDWLPNFAFIEAFKEENLQHFEWNQLLTILLVAIPLSFVTICEHIGDHLNVSSIVDKDLLKDPGLDKTLAGDGIATAIGGILGGMGNTTYGENASVLAVSGVHSTKVVFVGAIMAILLGFCAPIMTLVSIIPPCVFGGISICIYGAIAISGFKTLQKEDFNNNKNLLLASVILVTGVGGVYLPLDFIAEELSGAKISGPAIALIIGVLLNLILNIKCKKEYTFIDVLNDVDIAFNDEPELSEVTEKEIDMCLDAAEEFKKNRNMSTWNKELERR